MKAITSLSVNEFQSHEDTILDLHPGLNVLVGPSDSGKSAIVRALRWALYNEPRGEGFVRVGAAGPARIQVDFSDGARVIRARGKNQNIYEANGQHFEGFGIDVPLEVTEAHGMAPVEIGDWRASVNLAYQLDPPFLLSVTAGTAAKVLGKLAGTEEVDLAGKTLAADLHRRRQEIKGLEGRIEDLAGRIAGYDYLPRLRADIDTLGAMIREVEALQARRNALADIQARLQRVNNEIWDAMATLDSLRWVDAAEIAVRDIPGDVVRLEALRTKAVARGQAMAAIGQAQDTLTTTAGVAGASLLAQKVKLAADRAGQLRRLREQRNAVAREIMEAHRIQAVLQGVDAVAGITEEVADIIARRQALVNCCAQMAAAENEAAQARAVIDQAEAEISLSDEYAEALIAAGVCPLCGAPADEQRVKEVV